MRKARNKSYRKRTAPPVMEHHGYQRQALIGRDRHVWRCPQCSAHGTLYSTLDGLRVEQKDGQRSDRCNKCGYTI